MELIQVSALPQTRCVHAKIVLGSPSAQCADVGICRVLPISFRSEIPCALLEVSMQFDASRPKYLQLQFSRMDTQGTARRHFERGYFEVKEAFAMPRFICARLGLRSFSVPPGRYSVAFSGDKTVVNLRSH